MTVRDADRAWASFAADRKKVADLFSGRTKALPYIRTLPGHEAATATKFRESAYFLPLVARTSEAFGGLVFAKTPTRTLPSGLDKVLADVTRSGQDIDRFAEQAFDGIVHSACVGVLVDYPETPPGMTVAEAEARGIRPFLTLYDANSILSARFTGEGEERRLGEVRLLEEVEEKDPKDEWALVEVEQVRVLDFDDAGFYRQRVFRDDGGVWKLHGEVLEPRMGGQRLRHLPIYFSNARDGEPRPGVPPIRDIADISIAHLNDSAAYQWGLLWTANPTPIFKGLDLPEGATVKLGSSEGIAVSEGGDAKFLEFTGQGLSELREAMNAKRKDAALMGARLLLEESKAAVAAETARIQRAGETSVVAGIANALSECLTKALTFLAEWAGVGGEVEYWLNTDLNPAGLSPEALKALLEAWMSGAITLHDLFKNLQRGEVIDPAKNFEDHQEELADEAPALGTVSEEEEPDEQPENAEAEAEAA